jgi:hypothetical protein
MSWVWDHSKSRGAQRLVLLAIADHANDDGLDAYPSVTRLARKTGMTERGVRKAIDALVELKELHKSDNKGGRGVVNRYRVIMSTSSTEPVSQQRVHDALTHNRELRLQEEALVAEARLQSAYVRDQVMEADKLLHDQPSVFENPEPETLNDIQGTTNPEPDSGNVVQGLAPETLNDTTENPERRSPEPSKNQDPQIPPSGVSTPTATKPRSRGSRLPDDFTVTRSLRRDRKVHRLLAGPAGPEGRQGRLGGDLAQLDAPRRRTPADTATRRTINRAIDSTNRHPGR